MVSMSELPSLAITFVLVAALFVAGFLVVSGLAESKTDSTGLNSTVANVTEGMGNVVAYAPVWGTIIGVAVLLAIVIGGFSFGRQKGYI